MNKVEVGWRERALLGIRVTTVAKLYFDLADIQFVNVEHDGVCLFHHTQDHLHRAAEL